MTVDLTKKVTPAKPVTPDTIEVLLPAEVGDSLNALAAARAAKRAAEKAEEAAKAAIYKVMDEGGFVPVAGPKYVLMVDGDVRGGLQVVVTGRVNTKMLEEEFPEIFTATRYDSEARKITTA